MLTHEPPGGWVSYGVTLTIPGPPPPFEKAKHLFDRWGKYVEREMGACAVWRVEVQARGALHWHCMVCMDRQIAAPMEHKISCGSQKVLVQSEHEAARCLGRMDWIRWAWYKALDDAGPQRFDPAYVSNAEKNYRRVWHSVDTLMLLPGAFDHCCDVQPDDGRGAWKRYLQDHASKLKQGQVADMVGRHWGVIGRKRFVRSESVGLERLSDRQYYAVVRMLQRLATPQIRAKRSRCQFGRRLGRRPRRGSWGRSVWFSRPDVCQRLIAWARQNVSERRLVVIPDAVPFVAS